MLGIGVGCALAVLALLVCAVRVDMDLTVFRNRRRGLYAFEDLQEHTGLATEEEIEAYTGKPLEGRFWHLTRAEFARVPRNRWVTGLYHPLLNALVAGGLVGSLVLAGQGRPGWGLLAGCLLYTAFCVVWDLVEVSRSWDHQMDPRSEEREAQAVSRVTEAIDRVCGRSGAEAIYGDEHASTLHGLDCYAARLESRSLRDELERELRHPGNAWTVKLLYRVGYWAVTWRIRRLVDAALGDCDAALRECGVDPESVDQVPSEPARSDQDLLGEVRDLVEEHTQRVLVRDDKRDETILTDLRIVEAYISERLAA